MFSAELDLHTSAKAWRNIIYSVFQLGAPPPRSGLAIALIGAHPGTGTTSLTAFLKNALEQETAGTVASLDLRQLANAYSSKEVFSEMHSGSVHAASEASASFDLRRNWRGSRAYRETYLARVRARSQYTLIDCPSLAESTDVLGITSLVDGFLLVVEANKTTKDQLNQLAGTIQSYEGVIRGLLLNKREYAIPNWFYSKLAKTGW